MKNNRSLAIVLVLLLLLGIFWWREQEQSLGIDNDYKLFINLEDLSKWKFYSQQDFELFQQDYRNNKLEDIYITDFLFDGVSMYRPYDLEDFIEMQDTNLEVEPLQITVINIHKPGVVNVTGEIGRAMIAINTNNQTQDFIIELNNVELDTKTKKVPAIYAYNKDRTYDKSKVVIRTLENTKNYILGGKLKKISLVPKEALESYASNYPGETAFNYKKYSSYYGIYPSEKIVEVLFAKVEALEEDFLEGAPAFYYKASGAISSDVDLVFEGKGYLEVISKNKEGIESKGNLSFLGSTGDYVVKSMNDSINTTTNSFEIPNARNQLTIDVQSLIAIVASDSEEGDAIDSCGEIIINHGRILALSNTKVDTGLDSTILAKINGGTILSIGEMVEPISTKSKNNYMLLYFSEEQQEGKNYTFMDKNNQVFFSFTSDRPFKSLTFSSPELKEGRYILCEGKNISGSQEYGLYSDITSIENENQYAYFQKMKEQKNISYNALRNRIFPEAKEKDFNITKNPNIFLGVSRLQTK